MPVAQPVYVVFLKSGSTVRHTFSSGGGYKILSYSVKPGLTNTIGSFELKLPDISGSLTTAGAYNNVLPFEDVEFWLGWTNTGSKTFAGKIETIKSSLSINEGYTRTFLGSDYGECLRRVLVNSGYVNNSGDTIIQNLRNHCTVSTTGNLSTSNTNMVGDSTFYNFVFNNESVSQGMKTYGDKAYKDFYVDTSKLYNLSNRDGTVGSEIFTVGTNILEYSVTEDLDSVKNDIYVFGMRNSVNISGSDIPVNHDDWTENNLTNWSAWIISQGVPPTLDNTCTVSYVGERKSGSYSVLGDTGSVGTPLSYGEFYFTLTKTLTNFIPLTDGDFVHFYSVPQSLNPNIHPQLLVQLNTVAGIDYFETKLEASNTITPTWSTYSEYSLNIGPSYEGNSTTGSMNTYTGSYLWTRVGNPDWFKINSITFVLNYFESVGPTRIGIGIDELYFGTKYYSHKSGSNSINNYGLRRYIHSSNDYNSNEYCASVASVLTGSLSEPVTQTELTTTGSYGLVLGNKYLVTVPAENIADNLQLIDLEHTLDTGGALTKCIFTNKKELRTIIPIAAPYEIQQIQWQKGLFQAILQPKLKPIYTILQRK